MLPHRRGQYTGGLGATQAPVTGKVALGTGTSPRSRQDPDELSGRHDGDPLVAPQDEQVPIARDNVVRPPLDDAGQKHVIAWVAGDDVERQAPRRQLGVQEEALDEPVQLGGREADEAPKARGLEDPDDLFEDRRRQEEEMARSSFAAGMRFVRALMRS